jgi:hypothetical protein
MNFRSLLSNLDWLDILLAIVFTALLTGIGWLIQPDYGWGIGLITAPVLLGLAKSRRDAAREAKQEPETKTEPSEDNSTNEPKG